MFNWDWTNLPIIVLMSGPDPLLAYAFNYFFSVVMYGGLLTYGLVLLFDLVGSTLRDK